jgi:hypothetical protein
MFDLHLPLHPRHRLERFATEDVVEDLGSFVVEVLSVGDRLHDVASHLVVY